MFDKREFYEKQVEWCKRDIDFSDRHIKTMNELIAMERKEEKRIVEYVWRRGVLTDIQMRIYANPKKPYKTEEHKQYEKDRNREYRRRRESKRNLIKYEALLKTC